MATAGANSSAARPMPVHATGRSVLLGVTAGTAATLLLWWHDTPGLHGFGDWLTNAGRLTGLLAGYAVVVQLILMARVPALEHGIGAARLARWHAFGGRYTISLATAHTLLIIWGYAVTARQSVVGETGRLLTSYPDVLMATAALGLFLMVAAVSARAARARLRYETWYYLHFYTYLAVALAFSHQFATGADFMASRPARVFWAALYLSAAALLLTYRVAVPLRTTFRHRMRVADLRREAPGVVSLHLAGRHLDELGAQAGQFLRFRFLTRDHWWQSHPYSLSAPPHPRMLRITVKALGDHSTDLSRIRKGTRVHVEGPYGALTGARRTRPKVLLLAGGIGITPLRALFETLPARPGELTLLYRSTDERDLVFRRELDAIAQRREAPLHYLTGPSHVPGGDGPLSPKRLAGLVPDLHERDVYLCGSPRFLAAAQESLRAVGVPARQVHTEEFAF